MSRELDPFEKLARFEDPEPDPAIMRATIAQSRDAFAKQTTDATQPKPISWTDWLKQSTNWLVPAGTAAAALTIAVVLVPSFTSGPPTSLDRQTSAERSPPPAAPARPSAQVSPNELARSRESTAESSNTNAGTRMGMRPGQAPAEPPPMISSIFQGDGIRIGSRLGSSALELYLPDISGERSIDSQPLVLGEEVEILDAFQLSERDLIAIRLRVDSGRFWRIYRPQDGSYVRDSDLSQLMSDATDKTEVESRLPEN